MAYNSWYQTLITQQGAGPTLVSSSTPTSLLLGQAKYIAAASWIDSTLRRFRIIAHGKISTLSASPGTFTIDVRFGSVVVFTGGASGLATSASNLTWELVIDLIPQTIGSGTAATMLGVGKWTSFAISATTPLFLMPASSPAAGTGFDSTTSFTVDLFGTWSVSNAANSITCTDYELCSVN